MSAAGVRRERLLTWRHAAIAGAAYLVAALLVLALSRAPLHLLAIVLGPFAGGAVRDWQRCCAASSLALAPYALALLGAGVLIQLGVPPVGSRLSWTRLWVWALACTGWFFLAVVSYLHALE